MWESTTKYFSPFFSYTATPVRASAGGPDRLLPAAAALVRPGGEVEAEVLSRVLRVGDHDRPVVKVDHPAVVRRHVLLELGGVEVARILAEGLGDLVVDDLHPADRVDPDHRRERQERDIGLGA